MDIFTALRRRRPRDHLTWQQLRDWQLRDIDRLREGQQLSSEQHGLRMWVTALQYNELASLRIKNAPQISVNITSPLYTKEWEQPEMKYGKTALPLPRTWDGLVLTLLCGLLFLLTLATLLETCGLRIIPRQCMKHFESKSDDSFTLSDESALFVPPALRGDLPPPYSAGLVGATTGPAVPPAPLAGDLPVGYKPLANERPPPAYSEVFVQIPKTKIFYTNEMQELDADVDDDDLDIEDVGNHGSRDAAESGEVEPGGSVLV